jgi:hypothetical protein
VAQLIVSSILTAHLNLLVLPEAGSALLRRVAAFDSRRGDDGPVEEIAVLVSLSRRRSPVRIRSGPLILIVDGI